RQGRMRYRPRLNAGERCLLRAARLGRPNSLRDGLRTVSPLKHAAASMFDDKRSRALRFTFDAAPCRGLPEIEIDLAGHRLARALRLSRPFFGRHFDFNLHLWIEQPRLDHHRSGPNLPEVFPRDRPTSL